MVLYPGDQKLKATPSFSLLTLLYSILNQTLTVKQQRLCSQSLSIILILAFSGEIKSFLFLAYISIPQKDSDWFHLVHPRPMSTDTKANRQGGYNPRNECYPMEGIIALKFSLEKFLLIAPWFIFPMCLPFDHITHLTH